MKKNTKREGFTLVELLIVIVVIGVLSAMMMLSSTEAVSSAKAADIVSDLRNLKTAALAWYADNLDYVEGKSGAKSIKGKTDTFASKKLNNMFDEVKTYMSNENINSSVYSLSASTLTDKWFVWCKVDDTKVRDKLAARKSSTGLWTGASANAVASTDKWTDATTYVGMFIR